MTKLTRWVQIAVFWLSLGLVLAGCDHTQDQIQSQGQALANKAQDSLASAFSSAMESGKQLTQNSSKAALEEAKKQASDLEARIASAGSSEVDKLKGEVVKDQIARLDAAISVQSLKAQTETLLKRAGEGADNAGKSLADQRKHLRDTNETFRDADNKLMEAERAYRDATNRWAEALKQQEQSR